MSSDKRKKRNKTNRIAAVESAPAGVNAPAFNVDDLGELPSGYQQMYLIARDPHWLYCYWDFDYSGFPKQRQLLLQIYRDETLESSIEINEIARNLYIPVRQANTRYRVAFAWRDSSGRSQEIGSAGPAQTPPESISTVWDSQFATIPFHLSFNFLMETIAVAQQTGEPLSATLARLQQSGGSSIWGQAQLKILENLFGGSVAQVFSQLGSSGFSELLSSSSAQSLDSQSASELLARGRLAQILAPAQFSLFSAVLTELSSRSLSSSQHLGEAESGSLDSSRLASWEQAGHSLSSASLTQILSSVGLSSGMLLKLVSSAGLSSALLAETLSSVGLSSAVLSEALSSGGVSSATLAEVLSSFELSSGALLGALSSAGLSSFTLGEVLSSSGLSSAVLAEFLSSGGLSSETLIRGLSSVGLSSAIFAEVLSSAGLSSGELWSALSSSGLSSGELLGALSSFGLSSGELFAVLSSLNLSSSGLGSETLSSAGFGLAELSSWAFTTGGLSSDQLNSYSLSSEQFAVGGESSLLSSWPGLEFPLSSWSESSESSAFSGFASSWTSDVGEREFFMHVNAEVIFYGGTHPQARVSIAGQPIALQPEGTFRYHFRFPDDSFEIPVVAVSPDGQESRSAVLYFHRGTTRNGDVGSTTQPLHLGDPMGKLN